MSTDLVPGDIMETERKRKRVFWSALVASFVASLLALWMLKARSVTDVAFAAIAAWHLAGAACRRRGLSLEGRTSEALERGGPARSLGDDGTVAVPSTRWPWVLLASLLGILALMLGVLSLCIIGEGWVAAYLVAVAVCLASLACWTWRYGRRRIEALADDDGILRRSFLGDERIAWERVAEVRVQTERNVFGKPLRTECRFRGHSGRTLLAITLELVPEDARDRFIEAIRAKQGLPPGKRTELEAAMAPEGTGLEPEAAPAPAGRGTEPEASGRAG